MKFSMNRIGWRRMSPMTLIAFRRTFRRRSLSLRSVSIAPLTNPIAL